MRFGLKDIGELPSMEEFEKLGDPQADLFNAGDPERRGCYEPPGRIRMRRRRTRADISAAGVRESEAEAVMSNNPVGDTSGEQMPGEGDTSEPVTEAVPEASDEHTLVGERTVGEDGTYATEAEPGSPSDKT